MAAHTIAITALRPTAGNAALNVEDHDSLSIGVRAHASCHPRTTAGQVPVTVLLLTGGECSTVLRQFSGGRAFEYWAVSTRDRGYTTTLIVSNGALHLFPRPAALSDYATEDAIRAAFEDAVARMAGPVFTGTPRT